MRQLIKNHKKNKKKNKHLLSQFLRIRLPVNHLKKKIMALVLNLLLNLYLSFLYRCNNYKTYNSSIILKNMYLVSIICTVSVQKGPRIACFIIQNLTLNNQHLHLQVNLLVSKILNSGILS